MSQYSAYINLKKMTVYNEHGLHEFTKKMQGDAIEMLSHIIHYCKWYWTLQISLQIHAIKMFNVVPMVFKTSDVFYIVSLVYDIHGQLHIINRLFI